VIIASLAASRDQVSGPSRAATRLDIPPSTLDRQIKSWKITKKRFTFRQMVEENYQIRQNYQIPTIFTSFSLLNNRLHVCFLDFFKRFGGAGFAPPRVVRNGGFSPGESSIESLQVRGV
jgi:hypothetical protein